MIDQGNNNKKQWDNNTTGRVFGILEETVYAITLHREIKQSVFGREL